MTMSLAERKKNSTAAFNKLNDELNKLNEKSNSSDDNRFWNPTVDKAGNGYAIVRFLDTPEGEDMPYIRRWDHGFKGPGGWYINLSLNTLGKDDPVSEMNRELWGQGEGSEGRRIVSGHGKDQPGSKRRLHYIANILIIQDSAKPENNGKVMLWKFGMKIFDKLNDAMNPKFEDEKAVNPFDFWAGADFKVKIRNVEGYRNYDKSEFEKPAPLGTDEEIEAVLKQCHSLKAFLEPKLFKSYEELKRRLDEVMGGKKETTKETIAREDRDERTAPAKESRKVETKASTEEERSEDDAADEGLDFFKRLAKG